MEVVTLIIAVVALVIAVITFVPTGGIKGLRRQLESLSTRTETARDRTAEALDRLERLIRGEEKPLSKPQGGPALPSAGGGS